MNAARLCFLVVFSLLVPLVLGHGASAQTNPTYVNPSSSQQITGPDSVCKNVTNNNASNKLCVMTGTTAQWQSFYNNPNGATVTACAAASCAIQRAYYQHCSGMTDRILADGEQELVHADLGSDLGYYGLFSVRCANGNVTAYTGSCENGSF